MPQVPKYDPSWTKDYETKQPFPWAMVLIGLVIGLVSGLIIGGR